MANSPTSSWLPQRTLDILLPLREARGIWLVGGAIRDKLLDRITLDYDFAVEGSGRKIARLFANSLGGHYFDLDPLRDTGRVILLDHDHGRSYFDFASLRGETIRDDLGKRDFTINALAVDLLHPQNLIDIADGLTDIREGTIRAVSPQSFIDDPVRVLRAVRFALLLNGQIEKRTIGLLRESINEIASVSNERIRDELFNILDLPRPIRALRLMEQLGLISHIFPELTTLERISLPPTNEYNIWQHTLSVVDHLGEVLTVISTECDPDLIMNLDLGEYSNQLGKYRDQLIKYLDEQLSFGRSLHQLLILAAIFHDSGKQNVREVIGEEITFHGHAAEGAKFMKEWATKFRLSKLEVNWLSRVVQSHSRPLKLSREKELSKRAVYRFLRDTQDTAPGILLLSLADLLAKQEIHLDQNLWGTHIRTISELLSTYYSKTIAFQLQNPLLKGDDLLRELGVPRGPEIGRILSLLREAQAVGEIHTRAEALALAQEILDKRGQ